jgi:serine/threonine protein kinase
MAAPATHVATATNKSNVYDYILDMQKIILVSMKKTYKNRMARKTVRRGRKQHGGGKIGQGSYGAVFYPALKCWQNDARRPNHVSKILKNTSLEDELRRARILENLPGVKQYISFPDRACGLNLYNVNDENEFNETSLANFKTNGEFSMLLSPYSGVNLYKDFKLRGDQYVPFFNSLPNVFEAVQFLHANHIAHRDIKPANIVTLQQADGSFVTKLLDVGILVYTNQVPSTAPQARQHNLLSIVNYGERQIYEHSTSYMPFDVVLMYEPRWKNRFTSIESELRSLRAEYSAWTKSHQIYFHMFPYTVFHRVNGQYEPLPSMNDLINTLDDNFSIFKSRQADVLEVLARKLDIWCLGFTMMSVWRQLTNQAVMKVANADGTKNSYVYMTYHKFVDELGPGTIPVSSLEQILRDEKREGLIPQETIDWYRAVAEEITVPWNAMCMRMMEADPANRPELDESLVEFRNLLPVIQRLFSGANVYQHLVILRIAEATGAAAAGGGAAAAGGGGSPRKNHVAINIAYAKANTNFAAAAGGGGGGYIPKNESAKPTFESSSSSNGGNKPTKQEGGRKTRRRRL